MKTIGSLKDYYKILQVERSDNTATIKRVFRKRALEMHPDINTAPDAHEKFIELNEAYQVLRNPVKRKQYHRLLEVKRESQKPNSSIRRQKAWESSINSSAKKGTRRGEKYASETGKRFEKRTDSWASHFFFDLIFEITIRAIGAIFAAIFE